MTKHENKYLESLALKLPDEIALYKGMGDFEAEKAAIARWMEKPLSEALKDRLRLELEFLEYYPVQFPYTEEEALAFARKDMPEFSAEMLHKLAEDGIVEWMCINGEPHYIYNFWRTTLHMCDEIHIRVFGSMEDELAGHNMLNELIAEMKEKGSLAYKLTVKASVGVRDEYFVPGQKLRAWLPYPVTRFQQSGIEMLECSDDDAVIAPEDVPARTVYFEKVLDENRPFSMTYSYISEITYKNPMPRADEAVPADPAEFADDLKEVLPHIRFSPDMKALSREIIGDEKNPLRIARLIYDYVTTQVHYSYMRDYFLLEDIPQYCARNLRGDCGVQALLFITLCRLNGIPARWQSGLCAAPGDTGAHDWAMFYVAPFGWMYADPSYGGSAYRENCEERRDFYFGNIDPYRMAANHEFQAPLCPDVTYRRYDPYDNQSGEMATEDAAFLHDEIIQFKDLIAWEKLN